MPSEANRRSSDVVPCGDRDRVDQQPVAASVGVLYQEHGEAEQYSCEQATAFPVSTCTVPIFLSLNHSTNLFMIPQYLFSFFMTTFFRTYQVTMINNRCAKENINHDLQ